MIKTLLFDMGGVIFTQTTEKAFEAFRNAGIDTERFMGRHGQREFFLDLEMGRIGKEEFCREMSKTVGREVSMEEAASCWQAFYGGVKQEILDALVELRKDYRIGLLSNTNPFMMDFTCSPDFSEAGKPISDFFDDMYLSYELKAYKPDAEIFEKVLEKGGLKPEETLFIDDAMSNIEGAAKVGIQGLHVPTNEDWRGILAERLRKEALNP